MGLCELLPWAPELKGFPRAPHPGGPAGSGSHPASGRVVIRGSPKTSSCPSWKVLSVLASASSSRLGWGGGVGTTRSRAYCVLVDCIVRSHRTLLQPRERREGSKLSEEGDLLQLGWRKPALEPVEPALGGSTCPWAGRLTLHS